jgi:hypothetical protein
MTLCKCAVRFSPILAATLVFLLMIMIMMLPNVSTGFVILPTAPNAAVVSRNRMIPASRSMPQIIRMSNDDYIDDEGTTADNSDDEDDCDLEPVFVTDVRGRPAGVVLEDIGWRVEKLRLEEANKRRFLKSGPRFLPYVECKKWVQAWGERWTSAEEWYVMCYDVLCAQASKEFVCPIEITTIKMHGFVFVSLTFGCD